MKPEREDTLTVILWSLAVIVWAVVISHMMR